MNKTGSKRVKKTTTHLGDLSDATVPFKINDGDNLICECHPAQKNLKPPRPMKSEQATKPRVPSHLNGLVDMVTDQLVDLLVARVKLLGVHLRKLLQRIRHHQSRRGPGASGSSANRGGSPHTQQSGRGGIIKAQGTHVERDGGQGGGCAAAGGVHCSIHALHAGSVRCGVTGEGQRLHLQQPEDMIAKKLHLWMVRINMLWMPKICFLLLVCVTFLFIHDIKYNTIVEHMSVHLEHTSVHLFKSTLFPHWLTDIYKYT